MGKQIVVLLDGTWNRPEPLLGDQQTDSYPTNVYRLWLGLGGNALEEISACSAVHKTEARTLIYIRGVGTDPTGRWAHLRSGRSGAGTSQRIMAAYYALAQAYRAGDQLFFFGFSRGAFAARSLAGMVHCSGIVSKASKETVSTLFDAYLDRSSSPERPVNISYLGLWDTVGALSSPERPAADHYLSPPNVRSVRHAIALDEVRSHYVPIFWQTHDGQTVAEAWFSGAHSNIGGGYSDPNLSNIALFWVLAGAKASGLDIDLLSFAGFADEEQFHGMRQSYREFWQSARLVGKLIADLGLFQSSRSLIGGQFIHESVAEAIEKTADNSTAPYTPFARLPGDQPITLQDARKLSHAWGIDDFGQLIQ